MGNKDKVNTEEIGPYAYILAPDQLYTDYTQGSLEETELPLDFAIEGDGFFAIEWNGQVAYTRAGSFNLDDEGYLIAGGGDVGHIVGDHVQPTALTEHTGRQLIKASEHYVFAPLTPGAEFPRSCTAAYIALISGSRGNGSGISWAR